MENNVKVPQKIKNRTTIWSSNATSGYLLKENKNTNMERYMNCQVQCSLIYSSQDMEAIKMSTNNKCWRACGDKGTPLHCWWECIPTMENSMEAPYKTKNRTTIQLSNPISGWTTGEKYGSKGYMPLYVPYCSVYNNQDMKATYMSSDRWMDKEDLVHIYYGLFSSVAQSCLTLWNPMDCSIPGLPIHHQLSEFTQTHVHRVGDAIQPSHPLSSPSPLAPNPSQHQGLFQWVNSSHEVAKVLEFQLQLQFFQWAPRTDLL